MIATKILQENGGSIYYFYVFTVKMWNTFIRAIKRNSKTSKAKIHLEMHVKWKTRKT